jgi:DNA polymerase III gamma/tau subunit
MSNNGFVWVEKYRPKMFDDIVLDPLNRQILKNIIEIRKNWLGFIP